ncbi:Ribonucleoside-diphosphate reductase large subunit [Platanthera zijinensis]|uniref:Ribonucleoside-diphosphate reductase large subunit n=1 Tax=Platanthera zijinensis TaxID=2320716 RepID=A0AAP0G5Y1_9ASPA
MDFMSRAYYGTDFWELFVFCLSAAIIYCTPEVSGMKEGTSKLMFKGNGKRFDRTSGFDLPIQARSSAELARKFRQIKQEKADVLHRILRRNTSDKEQEVNDKFDQNKVQQAVLIITIVSQECNNVEESLNDKVKRNKRCPSMLIDEFVEVHGVSHEGGNLHVSLKVNQIQGQSSVRTESLQVDKDSQEAIVAQPNKEDRLAIKITRGKTICKNIHARTLEDREEVAINEEVPISVIASCNKIKALVHNNVLLSNALRMSTNLVLSNDGKKVRRLQPFTEADVDELQAQQLNKDIFETIYYHALDASSELAYREGPYETYQGSLVRYSSTRYVGCSPSSQSDWPILRKKIARNGIRNSLLVAPMPTASNSQILVHSDVVDSKEECHNFISAVIDQGSFDCSASSGVARNNVRCCSLPSGDIVRRCRCSVFFADLLSRSRDSEQDVSKEQDFRHLRIYSLIMLILKFSDPRFLRFLPHLF